MAFPGPSLGTSPEYCTTAQNIGFVNTEQYQQHQRQQLQEEAFQQGTNFAPMVNNQGYKMNFPPGYRFFPFDHELIIHYLNKKVNGEPLPHDLIQEVELYENHPEALAAAFPVLGENEWYFFTSRKRKYKNGERPKRGATGGFWKATGADRQIKLNNEVIGLRKTLVFYEGKPQNGEKTNWIMHEFKDTKPCIPAGRFPNDMTLNSCVLCRIYKKVEKDKDGCGDKEPEPASASYKKSSKRREPEARPVSKKKSSRRRKAEPEPESVAVHDKSSSVVSDANDEQVQIYPNCNQTGDSGGIPHIHPPYQGQGGEYGYPHYQMGFPNISALDVHLQNIAVVKNGQYFEPSINYGGQPTSIGHPVYSGTHISGPMVNNGQYFEPSLNNGGQPASFGHQENVRTMGAFIEEAPGSNSAIPGEPTNEEDGVDLLNFHTDNSAEMNFASPQNTDSLLGPYTPPKSPNVPPKSPNFPQNSPTQQ